MLPRLNRRGLWSALAISFLIFKTEAAPANDRFVNATVLDPTVTLAVGDNFGATREAGEPLHATLGGGKSVWWRYDAPETGFLTLSTFGSVTVGNFEMDTVLAVYTGDVVFALTEVASNDDDEENDTYASRVIFPVQKGTRYYIAVDGWPYEEGIEEGYIQLGYIYTPKLPTKPEPQWTLPSVDGGTVTAGSFAGEVRLVNFWATWCGPCIVEIPDLIQVHNKYQRFGFSVIGISIDNATSPGQPPMDLVGNFAVQYGMNYPVVMSRPGFSEVESQYGSVAAIPTTFLVDRNNNIVQTVVGSRNEAFFDAIVKPYLFNNVGLSVRREGLETVIEWPSLAGVVNAQLESASEANGTWRVSDAESTDDGTTTSVRINSEERRFYRLKINL